MCICLSVYRCTSISDLCVIRENQQEFSYVGLSMTAWLLMSYDAFIHYLGNKKSFGEIEKGSGNYRVVI